MNPNMDDSLEDFDIRPVKRKPFTQLGNSGGCSTVPKTTKDEKFGFEKKETGGTSEIGVQVSNDRMVSYNKKVDHMTHRSLLQKFFLKESTLEFCWSLGLLSRARKCPVCGNEMSMINDSSISDGKRFYCRVRKGPMKHEKRLSIRTGTFFENSNMTIEEVLEFLYLWVYGTPLKSIHHEMGLSSNTDVDWASFAREVCEMAVTRESGKIGGPGVVVEIDESKFAKRKYNRGHPVKTGWVFGGRERDNKKKIFMVCVPERSASVLLRIIQDWIEPGSIIWSDCWRAYGQIPSLPEGYTHGTVNHSKCFVDAESGVCTNRIESDWGKAKATLPKFGLKEAHLPGYLSTFMWRRLHDGEDLFMKLLEDVAAFYPGLSLQEC